jgi:hypothetical protein
VPDRPRTRPGGRSIILSSGGCSVFVWNETVAEKATVRDDPPLDRCRCFQRDFRMRTAEWMAKAATTIRAARDSIAKWNTTQLLKCPSDAYRSVSLQQTTPRKFPRAFRSCRCSNLPRTSWAGAESNERCGVLIRCRDLINGLWFGVLCCVFFIFGFCVLSLCVVRARRNLAASVRTGTRPGPGGG